MDEKDEFNLQDTIRNLEVLAHAPGDLKFRLALAQSIGNIHHDISLLRAEIKTLAKRHIPTQSEMALIVHREVKTMQTDVKRLWSAAVWMGIGIVTVLCSVIGGLVGMLIK